MKLLFLLLFIPMLCFGQHQERKLLLYNVGFGGLTAAIGATINKPKGGKWTHYFVKGFWQGSLGGALHYSSKKTLYFINCNKSLAYGWPAKLLHHAGNSLIENAALNEPFLQNWSLDFGPIRLDASFKKSLQLKARFLPYSVYSFAASASSGKLDMKTTLLTGNWAFKSKDMVQDDALGISDGRSFRYTDQPDKYHVIAHELVHQYQFNEYQVFNAWLKPLAPHIKENRTKAFFARYIYLDIPYFNVAYGLEGNHPMPYYYRNFLEWEAERAATSRFVPTE